MSVQGRIVSHIHRRKAAMFQRVGFPLILTFLAAFFFNGAASSSQMQSPSMAFTQNEDETFIESIRLLSKNRKLNGATVDRYKVTVYNFGAEQKMWFKVIRQDPTGPVVPTVIWKSSGVKRDSQDPSKWTVQLRKHEERAITFTVVSAGADKYCGEDAVGDTCTDAPSRPVRDD